MKPMSQDVNRQQFYYRQPVSWVVDQMGVTPHEVLWEEAPGYEEEHMPCSAVRHPWQEAYEPCPNPLAAFLQAWSSGYRRIVVTTGVNLGLLETIVVGGLFYLDTRHPSQVRVYHDTQSSLEDNFYRFFELFYPSFEKLQPNCWMKEYRLVVDHAQVDKDRWAMIGYTYPRNEALDDGHVKELSAGQQMRFQSFSKHATFVLWQPDRAHPYTLEACEDNLTGHQQQLIVAGHTSQDVVRAKKGVLCQCADDPSFLHIRVSGFDHPNVVTRSEVISGHMSWEHLQQMQEQHENGMSLQYVRTAIGGECAGGFGE